MNVKINKLQVVTKSQYKIILYNIFFLF